jgi:hypothetical protein
LAPPWAKISRVWRKVKGDWDAWTLKDEPIIRLILDGTAVRVRLDKKNLDLFAQGTGPWPDRLYEELSADYRIGKRNHRPLAPASIRKHLRTGLETF